MTATRCLYLARHAEAAPDGTGLTEAGRRRAELLGRRLRDIVTGPAERAIERFAPPSVLVHDDTRQLPGDPRWTGFPDALRV